MCIVCYVLCFMCYVLYVMCEKGEGGKEKEEEWVGEGEGGKGGTLDQPHTPLGCKVVF